MLFDFDKTALFIVLSMAYLMCASLFALFNDFKPWAITTVLIVYAFFAHFWVI